jgi:hypothetical protein
MSDVIRRIVGHEITGTTTSEVVYVYDTGRSEISYQHRIDGAAASPQAKEVCLEQHRSLLDAWLESGAAQFIRVLPNDMTEPQPA